MCHCWTEQSLSLLCHQLEAADFAPESPRRKTSADLGAAHGDSAEQQQEPEPVQRNSVEFMQTFLDHKNLEKIPSFLMLTVHDNGVQHYDNMTLRDLLRLVQEEVSPLCAASFESPADAMAVGQVKYRDIRRLESILSAHEEPAVLVRHHVVLMLLDPIRAIVLANKMIVVIPDGADSMISMLTNEINTQVQEESDGGSEGAPFEIKAYEAILDTVVRLHRQEHGRIAVSVRESLARLRKRAIVPAQLQERMRSLKNALSSVTARVSAHRRALDELLGEIFELPHCWFMLLMEIYVYRA